MLTLQVCKRVMCIDGQYSTLMSVVYQKPHGSDSANQDCGKTDIHVFHTVRADSATLLVKPQYSEAQSCQLDSLSEATAGATVESTRAARAEVELLFSDSPSALDDDVSKRGRTSLYSTFPNLLCVAKDPIHVALRVELARGGAVSPCSVCIRRCMVKFRRGGDDGCEYFRKGMRVPECLRLRDAIHAMSERVSEKRVSRIEKSGYTEMPYFTSKDFVLDIAAIAVKYKKEWRRKTSSKSTVLSSLAFATSPMEIQYLFNGARYVWTCDTRWGRRAAVSCEVIILCSQTRVAAVVRLSCACRVSLCISQPFGYPALRNDRM